jgi:hypothetical protein
MSNIFAETFQSNFNHDFNNNNFLPRPNYKENTILHNILATDIQVFKLLKSIRANTATGPDNNLARILREFA